MIAQEREYVLEDGQNPPMAAEPEIIGGDAMDASGLRLLSEAEVNRYLENRRQCAPVIALGVALCVACVAPLMVLLGLKSALFPGRFAIALGVTAMFVMIAAALGLFVSTGMRMSKYSYVVRSRFALSDACRDAVRAKQQDFAPQYKQSIVLGVVLCVLSAAPVTASGILGSHFLVMLGVAALMVIIAAGVFLFVRDGMIMGSFTKILKQEERSRRWARRHSR